MPPATATATAITSPAPLRASARQHPSGPTFNGSQVQLHQLDNAPSFVQTRAPAAWPPADGARAGSLRLQHVRVCPQPVQPAANGGLATLAAPAAATPDACMAMDARAARIHALLGALTPLERDGFAEAAHALDASGPDTLTRPALKALLKALKRVSAAPARSPRQQMLRMALRDQARAAAAELLLQAQIARHAGRQRANALPGSNRSVDTRGSAGATFGLPMAVSAGVTAGAGSQTGTATGEDLTIATLHTRTVRGDAAVQAGVAPGIGLEAAASGYYSRGHAEITASMRTHVLDLAHASVARRLGGNRLTRAVRRVFGDRRDRYAERISRAQAWEPRLQMLHGAPGGSAPLSFIARAGAPIQATVTGMGGALAASAGVGVGRLALSGELTRTTFVAALPTRLTSPDSSGMAPAGQADIRAALEDRLAPLLDTLHLRSPTLQQVHALRAAPGGDADLAGRLVAVDQLRSEFDHLEALARHMLVAPHQARPVLASLCRDWGSAAPACEPVMIGMLDTLAWLQAAPRPLPAEAAGLARWTTLQESVAALANRIHDTQLPHDRQRVHQATHGFREMTQRVITQRGTVALSAAAMPGGAAATVSVARHVREDPDPLRAGVYLELTLGLEASASIDAILAEVRRQWPREWEALPVQELEGVLSTLSPTLTATGSAQCLVRLFTPDFQRDATFPEGARGSHLQAVRLATGASRTFGVKVPLPLFPGVATTLGASHRRAAQQTREELLSERTLTGTLLRYQSLCTRVRSNAETWDVLLQSHGADLDRLCAALAKPDSVPAREARYWLRQGDGGEDALDAVAQAPDTEARHARLFDLFEAMGTGTARRKAASPLLGALALPAPSTA